MRRTQRRDLRRMGHDQDLPVGTQLRQTPPNRIGCCTTNTAINLIKDHSALKSALRQADFECQKKAAQFTSRGNFLQSTSWRARIGGHSKSDRIGAIWPRFVWINLCLKHRTLHLKRCQLRGHSPIERIGCGHARIMQPLCRLQISHLSGLHLALQTINSDRATGQSL